MAEHSRTGRLETGGRIDRSKPVAFTFDGRTYWGFAGDTLASALIANGRLTVGRSFKYHRPRGVMASGAGEPNALVRVGEGRQAVPNLRATQIAIEDRLSAFSQNCWPGPAFDVGAVTGWFSKLIPAGFYYKTFIAPQGAWTVYERFIRRAAGLGTPPVGADPERYEHREAHCDVLVIGGGAAGLAAADAATRTGARVVLCDDGLEPGGRLLSEAGTIDGASAVAWMTGRLKALRSQPASGVLPRTSAFAIQDGGLVLLDQDLGATRPGGGRPRRRLWRMRAQQIVLAAGAVERPLVFPGNDRPGVMLASTVLELIERYGVRPGRRAVVFANTDAGYAVLPALRRAAIDIAAVVDLRDDPGADARALTAGAPLLTGHFVSETVGRQGISGVGVEPLRGRGIPYEYIACDLLCMSGGWTPSLQLWSQAGGTLEFDDAQGALVARGSADRLHLAGAAAGADSLGDCIASGLSAGVAAAAAAGFHSASVEPPDVAPASFPARPADARVPVARLLAARQKSFVDHQNDVTVADLALAVAEGYRSIEHVKRYTTLGMGTDQGKTSAANGIAIVAELTGLPPQQVGHTTIRPPYAPVSFGVIAGQARGALLAPTRHTPFRRMSEMAGAVFYNAGVWSLPRYYPLPGESMAEAIAREAHTVRSDVGVTDVSTLGKIDIQGPDALAFLERVYCNDLASLAPLRARYSLMLREDGILLDDGTITRLGDEHYLVMTTTSHAGRAWLHMEKLRQVHWPELDLTLTSVTDSWGGLAIAGPRSRELVSALGPDFDVAAAAFPFLALREGRIAGLPARVFRVSFSGELGFEVHVPAGYARTLWERVMAAGRPLGLVPYGVEALDVLRIEKGHVVIGTEIDGRTTADDLGLGRMVSRKKDFIGRALLARPQLQAPGRKQLVGLVPADGRTRIPSGAQLASEPWTGAPQQTLGHVTASVESPVLGKPIALALLENGHARIGGRIHALSPAASQFAEAEIVSPHFFDPKGERQRG